VAYHSVLADLHSIQVLPFILAPRQQAIYHARIVGIEHIIKVAVVACGNSPRAAGEAADS
jgi:hypothetical protein